MRMGFIGVFGVEGLAISPRFVNGCPGGVSRDGILPLLFGLMRVGFMM